MDNFARFKGQKAIGTGGSSGIGLTIARHLRAEQVKANMDKIPMKRCGPLAEIGAVVYFIVTPETLGTTGFTVDPSGGRAVY